MPRRVSKLAAIVNPEREEVMQEPLVDVLQLGYEVLGPADRLVDRVQDLGNTALFRCGREPQAHTLYIAKVEPRLRGALRKSTNLALEIT